MRLKLKFSSARASINILYLVICCPVCSGHDAHVGVADCWVVKIMTRQMAGWVKNCDPVTRLSTFMRWINVDIKYWEGTCPSDIFLADIKNIHLYVGKKISSWAEHLGEI